MSKKLLSFSLAGLSLLIGGGGLSAADLPDLVRIEQGETIAAPGFDSLSPASVSSAVLDVTGYNASVSESKETDILVQADRHYQSKRFFESEKLYSEYVSRNAQVGISSDLALAYHRLGLIAKKRQLYDKAQQYLISAIKSDPNKDPQITLDYAIILFDLGEYERAKNFFLFLAENHPNLEEAKKYLGKTLLETDPGIEILPLLEAEYGRVEAGELLAERCRATGKTEDAQKIEKMIFDEKVKGDEVFFSPAGSVGTESAGQGLPLLVSAPQSVSFPPLVAANAVADVSSDNNGPGFAPFETKTASALHPASSYDPVEDALGSLASRVANRASSPAVKPHSVDGAVFGGYPGLSMAENEGVVAEQADPAYSVAKPVDEKVSEEFLPFKGGDDSNTSMLGVPHSVVAVDNAESYGGFEGYLPPLVSEERKVGVSVPRVSAGFADDMAPTPDFTFIANACSHDPEKVALKPVQPTASVTPVKTSPKVSPLSVPGDPSAQSEPMRRLTSEEKLDMAEKAGAKITYLTPDQYNSEIATRAGKVVQRAEEEITNSSLDDRQKQELLQKILGL